MRYCCFNFKNLPPTFLSLFLVVGGACYCQDWSRRFLISYMLLCTFFSNTKRGEVMNFICISYRATILEDLVVDDVSATHLWMENESSFDSILDFRSLLQWIASARYKLIAFFIFTMFFTLLLLKIWSQLSSREPPLTPNSQQLYSLTHLYSASSKWQISIFLHVIFCFFAFFSTDFLGKKDKAIPSFWQSVDFWR